MTLTTHEEVVDAEIVRTHTEWAEVIKSDLGRAVEGIVSAGKHLIAAKADVEHNEWLPMLKDIGLEHTMAKRLMAIGRNAGLKGANLHHLPSSVSALYELSRMDPTDIEDGIESGRITPNMKIKDAKAFASDEWPDVPAPAAEPAAPELQRDRNQEKRERDVSVANGLRNDLESLARPYLIFANGIADNLPGENMPPEANKHVADTIRDHLARITEELTQAIATIEGEGK